MVNTETGDILPFGTLGVHKKQEFKTAEVCVFIFDCIYYNGEDLTKKTMKERKKLLEDNIKPIKNHIEMSEYKLLRTKNDLISMIQEVLQKGLEGLVLKEVNGVYAPGKRHWFKVKKDYLAGGKMADTADLCVLGGWFGTGKKGGMLSIFLMGTYDKKSKTWKTVTKVHSGLDDSTIEKLQETLAPKMERCNPDSLPKWIHCNRTMIPDFISKENPENCMPVWEITGAEFSKAEIHTADGISIRFPRITKMRHDKKPKDATNLSELTHLFEESKKHVKLDVLDDMRDDDSNDPPEKTIKNAKSSDKDDRSEKAEKSSKTDTKKPSISNYFKKICPEDNEQKEKQRKSSTPKTEKRKQYEDDDSNTSEKKIKLDIDGVFSHVKLFVPENLQGKLKEDIRKFKEMGGKIQTESTECNYILHEEHKIVGNLESLR